MERALASSLWCDGENEIGEYGAPGPAVSLLTPYPCRAMASTRGLAMAEPSAGRVAVEVIVTLNRCTELATGTT